MSKQLLLVNLFCGLFPFYSLAEDKLHITVTNLKSKGTTYIAIYDKQECFGKAHKAFRKIVLKSTGSQSLTTTESLPSGNYAVAVYQDLNENKKIDKNMLGIPTEPFAFSNNVRPVVSAPTFKQCMITVNKPEQSISIKMMTYL